MQWCNLPPQGRTTPLPRRIRVVYLITSLEVGGSERSLVALVQGLPSDQYEKHIVCLSGFGPLEREARSAVDGLHDLRYPRLRHQGRLVPGRIPGALLAFPRFLHLLRQLRPDILHTMIPVCNLWGAIAKTILRDFCLVATKLALGHYRQANRMFARLEDLFARQYDLVQCKSQGILEDVAIREPIPRDRLRVVYNGIRAERYGAVISQKDNLRTELGVPPTAKIVGMVANLIPYKGHRDVLDAAPAVLAIVPDTWFLFVGRDDGIGTDLVAQAEALGISTRILFLGARNDVPELMACMDVLLSASHEEGFSNVILEAMASSLPVVATAVGGNGEAVVHGETGLLVPPRKPSAISTALLEMLAIDGRRRDMGQAGRARVQSMFSYEAMVAGITALYSEALYQGKLQRE